jgi:hypothetical protein
VAGVDRDDRVGRGRDDRREPFLGLAERGLPLGKGARFLLGLFLRAPHEVAQAGDDQTYEDVDGRGHCVRRVGAGVVRRDEVVRANQPEAERQQCWAEAAEPRTDGHGHVECSEGLLLAEERVERRTNGDGEGDAHGSDAVGQCARKAAPGRRSLGGPDRSDEPAPGTHIRPLEALGREIAAWCRRSS